MSPQRSVTQPPRFYLAAAGIWTLIALLASVRAVAVMTEADRDGWDAVSVAFALSAIAAASSWYVRYRRARRSNVDHRADR